MKETNNTFNSGKLSSEHQVTKSSLLKKDNNLSFFKDQRLLVDCENLTKTYGKINAINNLNLKIYAGKSIGIVGPNGGGKSTLVKMICGVAKPTKGKIKYYLDAKDPNKLTGEKELGRNIGVQFQESTYPIGLKVIDMLKFYLNLYMIPKKKEVLAFYIKTFKLEGLEKKSIYRLSGGQQQRVNIALSIIHNPRIVILDEVSTGLDVKARKSIRNLIKNLTQQNHWTLLLVTHNMEEIEYLCDRVIYLRYGSLVVDDKTENIDKQYGSINQFIDDEMQKDEEIRQEQYKKAKV